MGLFLNRDIVPKSATQTSNIGSANAASLGGIDFSDNLLLSIPSIFSLATQLFGENDSEENGGGAGKDPEVQAKIDSNQKDLEAVYSEASQISGSKITEINGFDTAIGGVQISIKNTDTEINNLKALVAGDKSSSSIASQISEYYDLNTGNVKQEVPINKETGKPEIPAGLPTPEDYNNALQTEQKIKVKEEELDKFKLQEVKLTALKGQAENLQDRINKLKYSTDSKGNQYNVKKETNDIKTFMTALKNFQEAKPAQKASAAEALKAAYENNGKDKESGIQQKSVQNAYDLIAKQYPEYFRK